MIIKIAVSTKNPSAPYSRWLPGGKGEVCPLAKKRTFGHSEALLTKQRTSKNDFPNDTLYTRYHQVALGALEKYSAEKLKIPYKKICSIGSWAVD
jgi:hypothetical protein